MTTTTTPRRRSRSTWKRTTSIRAAGTARGSTTRWRTRSSPVARSPKSSPDEKRRQTEDFHRHPRLQRGGHLALRGGGSGDEPRRAGLVLRGAAGGERLQGS